MQSDCLQWRGKWWKRRRSTTVLHNKLCRIIWLFKPFVDIILKTKFSYKKWKYVSVTLTHIFVSVEFLVLSRHLPEELATKGENWRLMPRAEIVSYLGYQISFTEDLRTSSLICQLFFHSVEMSIFSSLINVQFPNKLI